MFLTVGCDRDYGTHCFLHDLILEVGNSENDTSVNHHHLSWPDLQPEEVSIQEC